jgi:hypothetical protein
MTMTLEVLVVMKEILVVMKERGKTAYYNDDSHPTANKAETRKLLGDGKLDDQIKHMFGNESLLVDMYGFGGYDIGWFSVARVLLPLLFTLCLFEQSTFFMLAFYVC